MPNPSEHMNNAAGALASVADFLNQASSAMKDQESQIGYLQSRINTLEEQVSSLEYERDRNNELKRKLSALLDEYS